MTEYLFIGTDDQKLKQYDVKGKEVVQTFCKTVDPQETYFVNISENGKYLMMATVKNEQKQFDLKTGELIHSYGTIADNFVSSMKVSADGKTLFCSSMDETLMQFSLEGDKKIIHTIHKENIFVMEIAQYDDKEYLFTVCDGNILKQWSVDPKLELYKDWGPVEGPDASIESLAYSKLHNSLYTTSEGVITQWDVKTGLSVRKIEMGGGAVMCMVVDPKGQVLFASTEDGKLKEFRVSDGVCRKDWSEAMNMNGLEEAIAISSDGEWLFTANECETVVGYSLINDGVNFDTEEVYGGWFDLCGRNY